jgi:hypothetical protein
VHTDLDDLQLPLDVTLEPHQKIPFYIFAKNPGPTSLVGYIKFIDDINRFFWYSVALESGEKKVR